MQRSRRPSKPSTGCKQFLQPMSKNRLPLSAIDPELNFAISLIGNEADWSSSVPSGLNPLCEDPQRAKTNKCEVWQTFLQYLETPA